MAITEDPSTPLIVNKTGSGNPVTASFSPPSGTLLVALVAGGWGSANPTAVVTDSGGHTWTVAATSSGTGAVGGIAKIAYTYLTSAPGAITVTAAFTGLSGGSILAVRVLNGAKSSQTGAASAVAQSPSGSTVGTVSVTTTAAGSQVYGVSSAGTNNIALTLNGASSFLAGTAPNAGDFGDTTDSVHLAAWKATAVTGTPGATTLGGSWASSTVNNQAAFEVLAAATATLQGATALAGTAALTAAAGTVDQAAATLAATSTLDGPAAVTAQATSGPAGTASLTAAAVRVQPGAATPTAVSTIVAAPFLGMPAAVAAPGVSGVTVNAVTVKTGAAALTSSSSLSIAAILGPATQLIGSSALSATVGVQTEAAAAALLGSSGLAPMAGLVAQAAATLPGESALIASVTTVGSATLSATSTLDLGPALTELAATAPAGLGSVTGTAQLTALARVTLAGSAGLIVGSPLLIAGGTGAVLVANSSLTAAATRFVPTFVWPTGPAIHRVKTPTYRLYAANTRTGRVGWELPFDSVSWNTPINATGVLRATLPVESTLDALADQGARDPRTTFREVLTGPYLFSLLLVFGDAVVFAGPYLPASVPADKPTVDIGAAELAAMFDKRLLYTPGTVSMADPGADLILGPTSGPGLIKAIIDAATSGVGRGLPITCTTPPDPRGSEQRVFYGFDLTTAGSALSQLTAQGLQDANQPINLAGGPDYRLDPYLTQGSDGLYVSWELRIGNPYLGQNIAPWVFDDATSLISQEIDASRMASTYYVPGSGTDRVKMISVASDNSLITSGWPALEEVDGAYTAELDPIRLQSYAIADVARYLQPVDKWVIKARVDTEPKLGSFRVGDPMIVDIQRHPVIDPGIYARRITEISGDASAWVSLSSTEARPEL